MRVSDLRLDERVPKEDREVALHVDRELTLLCCYADELGAAISLFQTLKAQLSTTKDRELKRQLHSWQSVAARDGAVTIFNFAECMEGIKEQLHATPSLKALVDWREVRSIGKDFKIAFPDTEKLRHAVTHAGELTKSPKQREKNLPPISFQNCISGDNYVTAHGGVHRSYAVTPLTFQMLGDFRDRFIAALKQSAGDPK